MIDNIHPPWRSLVLSRCIDNAAVQATHRYSRAPPVVDGRYCVGRIIRLLCTFVLCVCHVRVLQSATITFDERV
jgi:hypothetical protein